jgi:hypothetical protein
VGRRGGLFALGGVLMERLFPDRGLDAALADADAIKRVFGNKQTNSLGIAGTHTARRTK